MSAPFVIERIYDANINTVWEAITDKEKMKQWYFDVSAFKPEVGFKFQFYGEDPEQNLKFLHLCRVTEVIPPHKLSYTWAYDGFTGSSLVTFELFDEGDKTRVKLTHDGLDTFPSDHASFAKENFAMGWTHIIGTSLKDFTEQQ